MLKRTIAITTSILLISSCNINFVSTGKHQFKSYINVRINEKDIL